MSFPSSRERLLIIFVALFITQCSSPGPPARTTANADRNLTSIAADQAPATSSTGEYLVTLKDHAPPSVLRKLCLGARVKQAKSLGKQRFLLRLRPDPGLEAISRAADQSGEVSEVQPNFRYDALPALKLNPIH